MPVKEQVRKIIEELPDECTVEEVQHRLYLLEKVQSGLKSIDDGRGIAHEDVKRRLGTWPTK